MKLQYDATPDNDIPPANELLGQEGQADFMAAKIRLL